MNSMKYVDIVLVKAQTDSGRLKTCIDAFGNIFLEDTFAGEAVKIGALPKTYSFHPNGTWEPQYIYTRNGISNHMQGKEGWACSECGWVTDERHDWCTCGADMRESNKMPLMTKKHLEEILKDL